MSINYYQGDVGDEESDEFLDEDIDDRAEDKAADNDKKVEWERLFEYVSQSSFLSKKATTLLFSKFEIFYYFNLYLP